MPTKKSEAQYFYVAPGVAERIEKADEAIQRLQVQMQLLVDASREYLGASPDAVLQKTADGRLAFVLPTNDVGE